MGAPTIRDFRGTTMGQCDKGPVITTGTLRSDARKKKRCATALAIDLIDSDGLSDLLKSLKLGVEIEHIEKVTIREDWFTQI